MPIRETEILDVAPMDMVHGFTKHVMKDIPFPDHIKAQGMDIEFHWVNEKGGQARLTSGVKMQATVSA